LGKELKAAIQIRTCSRGRVVICHYLCNLIQATGVKPIPPEFEKSEMMTKFIEHVKNTRKEQRFSQPSL